MIGLWVALLVLGLLVLVPASLRAGRGLVPIRRRLVVATALAVVATVPVLPTFVMPSTVARGFVVTSVVTEDGTLLELPDEPVDGTLDLVVVMLGWWLATWTGVHALRMPSSFRHVDRLQPVADPALVARVEQLARSFRLAPPRVLQPASIGGNMEMFAFATGLLVPVVVLSDGIGHRLSERERDAVIAHELAHLASRHVQGRFLMVVGVALAAVLVSGFVPLVVALLWMIATLAFCASWGGHRRELVADRAAGRVVGHDVAASGLDKLHVVHQQSEASPWLHALLSHPSLAVRALHLAKDAAADVRERIVVDEAMVMRSVRARRIAMMVWASALAAVVWAGHEGHPALAGVLAFGLVLVPLLLRLAFRHELREFVQLGLGSLPGRVLRRALLVLCCLAMSALTPLLTEQESAWSGLIGFASVLLVLASVWVDQRERRAKSDLRSRLHEGDLKGYLQGCERLRPRWRRRPEQRLQEALVRAAIGEREAAQAQLVRLAADWPRYRLVLVRLAREWRTTDPAASLRVARELAGRLPNHSIALGTLAGCLLYAGEFDEAWTNIERVVSARPRLGGWQALRSRIALARGDRANAQLALALAERLAPGDPATVLARAEFEATTRGTGLDAAMAKLREMHRALPLAFLGEDLARLEQRLAGSVANGV